MAESTSSAVSTDRFKWLGVLACVLLLGGGGLWYRHARDVAALEQWHSALPAAVELARRHERPLHVHFTSAAAPLASRMDETLVLAPVRGIALQHFVNVRLDARSQAELFRRLVGGAGALASCVVDVRPSGELDPVAVAAGYLDGERYVAFLHAASATLPRLRELRDARASEPAAQMALGELYAAQGSIARARQAFASVRDAKWRGSALEHLARLDLEAGHVAQARRLLEEAKRLDAAPDRLWLTEALLLSGERRVSDAVSLLAAGLGAARPADERGRALLLLGQLEHELKRDSDALAHLEQLRREAPDTPWSRLADERIDHIKNPQPNHQH